MKVIGIDPGANGAISLVSEKGIIECSPLIKRAGELDFLANLNLIENLSQQASVILIEKVQAIFGSSAGSTFKFGRNYQMAIDCALQSGAPVEMVSPKDWQSLVFRGETPVYKLSKKKKKRDTKKMALLVAGRLFPGESFLATERSSKAHDGMVDASLIAYSYFLRRGF